jgi:hypothetical protein
MPKAVEEAQPAGQTKTAEEIRRGSIKELADNYETLKPKEKLKLRQFIDADIQDEIASIEKTLSELKGELSAKPAKPAKPAKTTNRTRTQKAEGALSVKDAMAKVIQDGKEYKIAALTAAAEILYGSPIKKASVNNALQVLKKDKVIKPVGRGVYKKA